MPNKTRTRASEKSSVTVRKPQPAARASHHTAVQIHPAFALARAMAAPAEMISPADILTLQRAVGNRAVEHILADSQQHEQPIVEQAVARARGGGHALPDNLRVRMERGFGADFSRVRVHADTESDGLNRSLGARAFTTGHDLFFKKGEYNPVSHRGQKLIAHELTHVVQQSGGAARKGGLSVQRAPANLIQRSPAEIVADRDAWKKLSTSEKALAVVKAPIIEPFVEMWENSKAIAPEIYKSLLGEKPGVFSKLGAGLVAFLGGLIGGGIGLVQGAMQGLAHGIGNPLYSMGKRLVKGALAVPQVLSEIPQAIINSPTTFNEARGVYKADPTHPKYGNYSRQERIANFLTFGNPAEQRKNYNKDTYGDVAHYTLTGSGTATSASKFATGLATTGKAISQLGAASGVFGAVTSLSDASKGFRDWTDSSSTAEQQTIGQGRALSGLASATQQSATAAQNLGSGAVAATTQVVSGSAAIVTGAVDILRGVYAGYKADQNIMRLKQLQEKGNFQGPEGADIKKAAAQAESTQGMRRTHAIGTGLKGVATVVGGSLLAAAAVTPVGWALLGAGAVIGGIFALKRWWDKRNRKKEVAMRELGVTEAAMTKWEKDKKAIEDKHWWPWNEERVRGLKALGPDPLQKKLDEHGFKSFGHFYANYINYMANLLYSKGVAGRADLIAQLLEATKADPLQHMVLVSSLKKLSYMDLEKQFIKNEKNKIPVKMEGNHYPAIDELLESIGLRFNWQKEPPDPKPEKIGAALHN